MGTEDRSGTERASTQERETEFFVLEISNLRFSVSELKLVPFLDSVRFSVSDSDDRDDALDGEIDVALGRRSAEPEADRGAGGSPTAPIASRTCDGAWLPELHADPVETARSPSAISSCSPSTRSKLTCRLCGSRCVMRAVHADTIESLLQSVEQPAAQRAQPARLSVAISVRQISAAWPRPTMPGTLRVPDLKPFSWPPPSI